MLHDYLIVYQVRSSSYGVCQGNVYVNDFPLTRESISALSEKLLKETRELDASVDQLIILNIVELEKEDKGVVEYDFEVTHFWTNKKRKIYRHR